MPKIKEVVALEFLDCRGDPTVGVRIKTNRSTGWALVPSGVSTGKHEALELRDGGSRFSGKGVQKAVKNINLKIAPQLKKKNCQNQKLIDQLLIDLDGTINKRNLGANTLLGVSLANAVAASGDIPLYQYLTSLTKRKPLLPRIFFNIINGGRHADNSLSFQEFMVVPQYNSCSENIRAASETYHALQQILHQKYGKGATNVGNEGGFAPPELRTAPIVLQLLTLAIKKAGHQSKIKLAIDAAASEFYFKEKYRVDGKLMTKEELLNYYLQLIKKFSIISIEDPFQQEDYVAFAELARKSEIQIVTDDLTVTNRYLLRKAIENKSGNCLLLKVNQIGTLSEALDAAQLAFKYNWQVMVSHRSGETEDTFIADLAVALGCGLIKAGAPARGERTAKYNRLLQIEAEINNQI